MRRIFSFGGVGMMALLFLTIGCGAAGNVVSKPLMRETKFPLEGGAPKPASISSDAFRPNFGGDLSAMYYFPQEEIIYRIVIDGATDIRGNAIDAAVPDPVQIQDIHDAFAKWGRALSGLRTVREAAPGEQNVAIDVVVQDEDAFPSTGRFLVYGNSNTWVRDAGRGLMGRSLVSLRTGVPERAFRRTVLHEAGHALGLSGHGKILDSVMTAVQPTLIPRVELSQADVNTMRANYTRE